MNLLLLYLTMTHFLWSLTHFCQSFTESSVGEPPQLAAYNNTAELKIDFPFNFSV